MEVATDNNTPEPNPYGYYYSSPNSQKKLKKIQEINLEEKPAIKPANLPIFAIKQKKNEGEIAVDILNNISIEDLEKIVKSLEKKWLKMLAFVNDQEDELIVQAYNIKELQKTINAASQRERIYLEEELEREQEKQEMLNATLVGQRRNLQKQQELLQRHQLVLKNKQAASQSDRLPGEPLIPDSDYS
jgi:polysaccharide biosynthesis transport protein